MIFDITTATKLDKHHPHIHEKVFGRKSFIAFIHADWCGHCVRMLPEWRKFVKQMRDDKLPNFAVLDISDQSMNHVMMEKPDSFLTKILEKAVSGFPTIIFIEQYMNAKQKPESLIHNFSSFSTERTADELNCRFVTTKLKEVNRKESNAQKRSSKNKSKN